MTTNDRFWEHVKVFIMELEHSVIHLIRRRILIKMNLLKLIENSSGYCLLLIVICAKLPPLLFTFVTVLLHLPSNSSS